MSIVASVFLWIIPLLAVAALAAGLVAFFMVRRNERRKREEFQRRQAQAAQRRSQMCIRDRDYSIQRLTQEGFEPYYLYRQTRMAGNLENAGWAKPGSICRYNIYTMDESNTVIACGAVSYTHLSGRGI